MENKKVNIYVKGYIYVEGSLSVGPNGAVAGGVAENDERYDLSNALVIEGDITMSPRRAIDSVIVASKSVKIYQKLGQCRLTWDRDSSRFEVHHDLVHRHDVHLDDNWVSIKANIETCHKIDGDCFILPDGTALTYDGGFRSYPPGKYCIGPNARPCSMDNN